MNFGSPLKKHQKKPKEEKEEVEKPIEKFKADKPVISRADAKRFTGETCDPQQILWLERWLSHFILQNSYPPQMKGATAWRASLQFLSPPLVGGLLEQLRKDFALEYPKFVEAVPKPSSGDFDFLVAEESSLEYQRKHLTSDHNTSRCSDDDSHSE